MARFADTSVMQEVFVEFRLFERSIIVPIDVFIDGNAKLLSVWLENVCKVTGLRFGRNA
jgi:hypothetical protein